MRVISCEEQRRYLDAASQPLRDVAELILETGMRPEEVYRLSKANLHLERGYLYNPSGKTRAARRKINLTKRAVQILQARSAAALSDISFRTVGIPHSRSQR